MDNEVLITKKYNHMNFEMPFGYGLTLGVNCFNLTLGFVSMEDLNIISGLIGLGMNLVYFLYKMYRLIQLDQKEGTLREGEDEGDSNILHSIDNHLFKRRCVGCGETFEPEHPDQIFHADACRDAYINNVRNRKPFIKKQE